MRLWSLHPKYLDAKGLVALWREGLLAKHVLENKTRGYKNHPQLNRFKKAKNPVAAINHYLSEVYFEAQSRGYSFNKNKLDWNFRKTKLPVTQGQLDYEIIHLKNKLKIRDRKKHKELNAVKKLTPHPLFKLKPGSVEAWEIVAD